MNFKKLLSGSIAVVMMAGLMVGCGGGSNTETTTVATTTEATTVATTQATTQAVTGGDIKGSVNGNVYTNSAAGIKYTLPSGVTFSSLSSTSAQYDMMATNKSGEIIFVMVQDLGSGVSVTEETFAGMLKDQMKNRLENPTFKEIKKVNVGGVEFVDLTYSFTQSGISMSQVMLVKSVGSKMVVVNVTYRNESGRTELLSGVSAL